MIIGLVTHRFQIIYKITYLSNLLIRQKINSQNTNAVTVISIAKLANVSGALSKVVINES